MNATTRRVQRSHLETHGGMALASAAAQYSLDAQTRSCCRAQPVARFPPTVRVFCERIGEVAASKMFVGLALALLQADADEDEPARRSSPIGAASGARRVKAGKLAHRACSTPAP